jgi:GntR family transcriptional regulator / MocR family aminotransferase
MTVILCMLGDRTPELARRTVPVVDAEDGPVAGVSVGIDADDPRPLHEQLEQALRAAIRSGRLAAGSRLPSTRGLSAQLGISRGVVSAAYGQLAAEGYLLTRQGAPVRVSEALGGASARPSARPLEQGFSYDLRPGPDVAGFPRDRWQRSLRDAWRGAPAAVLADLDPRGIPVLRDALAAYLDRVRGTAADPELMLVCAGFAQGLSLTCRWLAGQGVERIAVEDPGRHQHRLIAEQAGLEAVPMPVDEAGLDVAALEASDAAAVVVTPAHHFPTGAVLGRGRRTALLDWAERHDGLIVEDDYDSELRFDGMAVGALQGLAPERVVHVGSASKRLAPGLRLAWILLPSWLTWPIIAAKSVEDGGAEVLGQLALADFVARGELDRHLRRMRLRYAARRRALLAALRELVPGARTRADAAGVFELVELPRAVDEPSVLAAAARRGVGLEGLAWHRSGDAGPGGVLAGYAGLPEPALAHAVRLLAEAVASVAGGEATAGGS